jgi:hypothetical protein
MARALGTGAAAAGVVFLTDEVGACGHLLLVDFHLGRFLVVDRRLGVGYPGRSHPAPWRDGR